MGVGASSLLGVMGVGASSLMGDDVLPPAIVLLLRSKLGIDGVKLGIVIRNGDS